MQIGDLPFAEKLSKTDDPYLGKLIEKKKNLFRWILEPPVDMVFWFSGAPHLIQYTSPCIPLPCRFFLTAIHPDTIYHRKSFVFRWMSYFPAIHFQRNERGTDHWWQFFLVRIDLFHLISKFNCVFFHYLWSASHYYLPSESCSMEYFLWSSHLENLPNTKLPKTFMYPMQHWWGNPL